MLIQRIMMAVVLLLLFAGSGQAARKVVKAASAPRMDAPEATRTRSGRYQLLPVEYTSTDLVNDTTATKKDLILLDTATGQMQVCSQKVWMNVAVGKEISERKCLPFDTYAEYPVGTLKGRKTREGDLPRP